MMISGTLLTTLEHSRNKEEDNLPEKSEAVPVWAAFFLE